MCPSRCIILEIKTFLVIMTICDIIANFYAHGLEFLYISLTPFIRVIFIGDQVPLIIVLLAWIYILLLGLKNIIQYISLHSLLIVPSISTLQHYQNTLV